MISRKAPSLLSQLTVLWAGHIYQPSCVRLTGSSWIRCFVPLPGPLQGLQCLMLPGKGHGLCDLPHCTCDYHGGPRHGGQVAQLHLRLRYGHWPKEGEALCLLSQTGVMPSCVQQPRACWQGLAYPPGPEHPFFVIPGFPTAWRRAQKNTMGNTCN